MEEISLPELLPKEDKLLIGTADSSLYFLQKNSSAEEMIQNAGSYFSDRWTLKSDTITMFNAVTYNPKIASANPFHKADSIQISYDAVTRIKVERYDTGKTILLILGLTAILVAIGFLIPEKEVTYDIPQIPNPFHY
jgi:hypothetical protein